MPVSLTEKHHLSFRYLSVNFQRYHSCRVFSRRLWIGCLDLIFSGVGLYEVYLVPLRELFRFTLELLCPFSVESPIEYIWWSSAYMKRFFDSRMMEDRSGISYIVEVERTNPVETLLFVPSTLQLGTF